MDLSKPDAQRYFVVRRAIAAGFDIRTASRPFREMYATLASFVGEYEEADALYPLPEPDKDPAAAGYVNAVPANPSVRAMSRGTRAVFINESHASVQTRAAIYTLLHPLREEGYRYLAIEGMTTAPAAPGACSDAAPFDAALSDRGYPQRKTGFYIREPVFAEIVREALRLGYRLVAYETTAPTAGAMEEREQRQAKNLACLFKDDPNAKLVVIAGFSHVSKSADAAVPGGMMAARFRTLTGIDPLTIDTTSLLHVRREPFRFGDRARALHPSQGFALVDAAGNMYGSDAYDLMILAAAAEERNATASWLELDGARKPAAVPSSGCRDHWPCLVEAFPAGETSGIPADSCVVETAGKTCRLFLHEGEFTIEYSSDSLELLNRTTIRSGLR
jgi:hypothetical protein